MKHQLKKENRKHTPGIYFFVFITSIFLSVISCSNDTVDSEIKIIEQPAPKDDKPIVKACTNGKVYHESNGIVRVDINQVSASSSGWKTDQSMGGFEGSGYIIWTGADNFNSPGQGVVTFSVKITTAGTYQFVWRSRIGAGTKKSEHNDSWLRIKGNDFFGKRASDGHRVYPKGSGKTPNPEGSSKDGWLKVYMNRVGEWFWKSNTNDKDPYDVFVTFNTPGVYAIEISGRSKSHAIDQFVLFKTDKSLSQAQNASFSETSCK